MCNIHIDNAAGFQKFHIQKIKGIYKFKRKNQKRCWAGNNPKQVFSNVKKEIVELIKEAKSGVDIQKIENNHIYQPTKAKITFLYNQERWIPISVNNDSDYFLTHAYSEYSKTQFSFIEKRELIYDFYKLVKDAIPSITTWRMMIFIYDDDGYRHILNKKSKSTNNPRNGFKNGKTNRTNKNLAKDIEIIPDFKPNISQSSYFEDDFPIDEKAFEVNERNKKIIGKEGERIVFKYLKQMIKQGFKKIKTPCFENRHNLHHDFSYVLNNDQFFVEVKSSARRIKDGIYFEMSRYEYEFMEKHKHHFYLYYVSDVFNSPTICIIKPENIINKLTVNKYELRGK
jgi:hypothetical protein